MNFSDVLFVSNLCKLNILFCVMKQKLEKRGLSQMRVVTDWGGHSSSSSNPWGRVKCIIIQAGEGNIKPWNRSAAGCGNCSITSGEILTGRCPCGCPFLSALPGWIWIATIRGGETSLSCLLPFPRCGWECGNRLNLPSIILSLQKYSTCSTHSLYFQREGIRVGPAGTHGKEVKFTWSTPCSLAHTPSFLFLFIYCLLVLRHLLFSCK